MRVLLIEDEALLAEQVADGLRDRGMAVDVAADGLDGLHKAGANRYDVVVLDRDLPLVHGDQVCIALAADGRDVRILMLTAAGEAADRVAGLILGADDYLPKPFVFDELVLRIRALARRANNAPRVLRRAGLAFDTARRVVTRDGRTIPLTTKELAVLEILMAAGGAVISAEDLLERAWDEHADPFTATVRVTIARLRRKLGDPPLLETVVGAGYRL
jgi:DNA-binding response OmpR family regulator